MLVNMESLSSSSLDVSPRLLALSASACALSLPLFFRRCFIQSSWSRPRQELRIDSKAMHLASSESLLAFFASRKSSCREVADKTSAVSSSQSWRRQRKRPHFASQWTEMAEKGGRGGRKKCESLINCHFEKYVLQIFWHEIGFFSCFFLKVHAYRYISIAGRV